MDRRICSGLEMRAIARIADTDCGMKYDLDYIGFLAKGKYHDLIATDGAMLFIREQAVASCEGMPARIFFHAPPLLHVRKKSEIFFCWNEITHEITLEARTRREVHLFHPSEDEIRYPTNPWKVIPKQRQDNVISFNTALMNMLANAVAGGDGCCLTLTGDKPESPYIVEWPTDPFYKQYGVIMPIKVR